MKIELLILLVGIIITGVLLMLTEAIFPLFGAVLGYIINLIVR
jgi:hypothetical protein